MSTAVMEIAEGVDERIEAVKDEIRRLEAAKAALLEEKPAVRGQLPPIVHEENALGQAISRARGSSRGRIRNDATKGTAKRRRSRQASRQKDSRNVQDRVLELIEAQPGISSSKIKGQLEGKIYIYTVIKRLQSRGLIEGEHFGWRLSSKGDAVPGKATK